MAFSTQEQEILRWGAKNGKSKQEVTDALVRFRTTGSPADPNKPSEVPKKQGAVAETFSDVKETVVGVGKQFGKAGEEIVATVSDKKLNPFEKIVQVGADAFRGASRAFGETVIGAGKTVLPQETEEAIGSEVTKIGKGLAQTQGVKDLMSVYSSLDPETKRNVDNALGFGEGLAEILTGGVASRVTKPIVKAGRETVGSVGRIASETADSLVGIVDKGTTGIQKATSATLDPTKIMQRVARISKGKQAAFEKQAGQSVGSYLVDNGIFGDIDEITTQLFDKFQKSRQVADDSLAKLKGNFKAKPVETALQTLFERETRVSSPGALSKDFARVRQLQQKYNAEGLNMSEINEVKRIYERNIKVDYLKSQNPEGVAKATSLDTALREWQFAQAEKLGLKNLNDINKNTRLSKQLLDDLGKEYAGSAGNNAVTLTDWIILSGLDPTAISAFIAKKSFSDKGIQSAIAKRLAGKPTPPDTFPIFDGTPSIDNFGEWIRAIESQTKK